MSIFAFFGKQPDQSLGCGSQAFQKGNYETNDKTTNRHAAKKTMEMRGIDPHPIPLAC
jgi:hypothetical protein